MTVRELITLLSDSYSLSDIVYVELSDGNNVPLEDIDINNYRWGVVIGRVEAN